MKTRILALILITLTIFVFVSCSSNDKDKNNSNKNNTSIYDVSTNSFEVKDYDFKVYTTHNLKTGTISNSYSFDFEAHCKYDVTECTGSVKFYSLENNFLYEGEIEQEISAKANENMKISIDVSENVYNNAYRMKIYLNGKTTSKPEETTSSTPITIKYSSVSFIDDDYVLLKSRVKSCQTIEENQITTPQKDGYTFNGWFLDKQLTKSAEFPLKVTSDINLYADWLQTYYSGTCKNATLKDWAGNDSYVTYDITPTGFDYDELEKSGYRITIKVTYDVYYKKDYDVPLDIGYAGAPEYSAKILKSNGVGYGDSDLSTSKTSKTRNIEVSLSPATFKNEKFTLKFSTDNIQNLVYIKNIKVEFICEK